MIDLPADHSRPSRQSFRGGLVRVELPRDVTAAARGAALGESCTLFMLLLASFAATLHRWSGRIAFLVAVPVAVHCLYALGYQTYETRVMWHSALGCFFFGAFSAKMLLLRSQRLPGWLLPLVGGLVFTVLTLIWLTSALWFFRTFGVTT